MKLFKFLSIAFPVYVVIAFLASYLLNLGINVPILDQIFQLIGMTVIIFTLPFTPLLKALGMYVTAYWSMPTNGGIILSLIIWEIIFIILFLIIRHFKKTRTVNTV